MPAKQPHYMIRKNIHACCVGRRDLVFATHAHPHTRTPAHLQALGLLLQTNPANFARPPGAAPALADLETDGVCGKCGRHKATPCGRCRARFCPACMLGHSKPVCQLVAHLQRECALRQLATDAEVRLTTEHTHDARVIARASRDPPPTRAAASGTSNNGRESRSRRAAHLHGAAVGRAATAAPAREFAARLREQVAALQRVRLLRRHKRVPPHVLRAGKAAAATPRRL
jgi:hypothetical protein